MSDTRTPAEALRKMADAVQERAHSSERACMSLRDDGAPEFVVAMARGEADATRRIEAMLRAEADRLDALPVEALSAEYVASRGGHVMAQDLAADLLADGWAIVRVKP